MLAAGPVTGPTRRINGGRHTAPPDAADDYYDEAPSNTWRTVGIIAAVLIALGLVGFVAYQVFSPPPAPRPVAVPSVVGQTVQDAQNQIIASDLRVRVEEVASRVDEVGRVTATNPAGGVEVPPRSEVVLSVGTGPAEANVPKLVGLSVEEAERELVDVGLKIGTRSEQETGEADQVGKVIRSDPDAGSRVAGASAVNVVIGKAQTTVAVPDVSGQDASTAQRTLQERGFQVSVAEVDGGGDQGSVAGTDPKAGTQAQKGSQVTLQVSRGNKIEVPDVVGLSREDAQSTLRDAGFQRINDQQRQQVDNESQDEDVLAQSIPPGTTADKDDQITILIGEFQGVGDSG